MRPDRYEIQWQSKKLVAVYRFKHPEDPDLHFAEPEDLWTSETWDDLATSRRRARAYAKMHDSTVIIYERTGIHDVTPDGDPPGLIWDWDDVELVDEVQP